MQEDPLRKSAEENVAYYERLLSDPNWQPTREDIRAVKDAFVSIAAILMVREST